MLFVASKDSVPDSEGLFEIELECDIEMPAVGELVGEADSLDE